MLIGIFQKTKWQFETLYCHLQLMYCWLNMKNGFIHLIVSDCLQSIVLLRVCECFGFHVQIFFFIVSLAFNFRFLFIISTIIFQSRILCSTFSFSLLAQVDCTAKHQKKQSLCNKTLNWPSIDCRLTNGANAQNRSQTKIQRQCKGSANENALIQPACYNVWIASPCLAFIKSQCSSTEIVLICSK